MSKARATRIRCRIGSINLFWATLPQVRNQINAACFQGCPQSDTQSYVKLGLLLLQCRLWVYLQIFQASMGTLYPFLNDQKWIVFAEILRKMNMGPIFLYQLSQNLSYKELDQNGCLFTGCTGIAFIHFISLVFLTVFLFFRHCFNFRILILQKMQYKQQYLQWFVNELIDDGIQYNINQNKIIMYSKISIKQIEQLKRRAKTQSNSLDINPKIATLQKKQPQQHGLPSLYQKQTNQQSKGSSKFIYQENSEFAPSHKQSFSLKSRSIDRPYLQKKIMQRAERIFDSLCKPTKNVGSIILVDTSTVQLAPPKIQMYQKARQIYAVMKKQKKTKDIQSLLNLITQIKMVNKLFNKIDDMLSLILLKRGKVCQFQQNSVIYYQNQPKNSFYIILWGEVKLKQIYRNKVKYLIPGDMLCEEVAILDKKKSQCFGSMVFIKGSYITLETAKSQTKCALLQILKQDFEQVKLRFAENSQKDKTMTLQRILTWSLSKKTKFRK